jgi:sulfite exporter TauE/SafE
VTAEVSYLLAFTAGLFGAPHCIGMCSGLAGGLFVHQGLAARGLHAILYHGARVLTYVVVGVAGALLGRVIVQSGWFGKAQGLLMIGAGTAIVVLGLGLLGLVPLSQPMRCRPSPAGVAPGKPRRFLTPVLAGIGNGLVPCSLVFSVAIKAVATASPGRAALLMLVFGLGTVPAMLGVSLLSGWLGVSARRVQVRIGGALIVALGLWTLYEGMVFYDIMRGLAD